ncbi:MAG: hypothetical protein JWP35_3759 [Caulobacter sp.]|nr:hypothetical protein [Caulobacter sp.]
MHGDANPRSHIEDETRRVSWTFPSDRQGKEPLKK